MERRRFGPITACRARKGAEFHPALQLPQAELILRKGFRPQIDSYSAFFENDRTTPTGLAGYLRERNLTRVFLAGLAYDYLRRLLGSRCAPRGVCGVCDARRLPGDRPERLGGADRSRVSQAGVSVIESAALSG